MSFSGSYGLTLKSSLILKAFNKTQALLRTQRLDSQKLWAGEQWADLALTPAGSTWLSFTQFVTHAIRSVK